MALDGTKWTIERTNGDIRYIGDDHGGASPAYGTVIEFHRWLQSKADDAVASGDDELDITNLDPSSRSTDNIITLKGDYNIDDRSAEFLYDGSIIQDGGDTIYDGIVNFGPTSVVIQIIQDGRLIADDFWNEGTGFNADANAGISHRFMVKTRADGVDIDRRRLIGLARTFCNTYEEFKINGTSRGNNVLALADQDDLNNEETASTVAGWTGISNQEGLRTIDVDGNGTDEEYWSEWNTNQPTRDINDFYERIKWNTQDPALEDSCSDSGNDFIIDNATITGAAQSFTVGSNNMLITKVVANLKANGSPTGDITCKIYTHSGTYGTSSVPNAQTGTTSEGYDSSLLTTTYEPVTFEFKTPVDITASTYYCVVFEHADGGAADYVQIEGSTSGTHSGNRSHNTAGWTAVAADDLAFEVYASYEMNGLPGSVLRGINYSFGYDTELGGISISTNDMLAWGTNIAYNGETGGPFLVGEAIVEDTATPQWAGRILAIDDNGVDGNLIVDIEYGTVEDTDDFTGQTSGANANTNGTPTAVTGGGLLYVLANDATDDILYVQVLRGTMAADDGVLYYCGTDPATADATDSCQVNDAGATITERSISLPLCGTSTGSAIIGSYGFGIESLDLASTDLLFDLTNTQRQPPNNVTNTVDKIESGDRVLVAPWDGSTYDVNGDPAIDKDQLSLDTALTTDNITQVEVTESIPSDTPGSGYIRVTDNNGLERRLHYNDWENGTPNRFYNIDTNDGNEDFAAVNADVGNDVYVAYIDVATASTSESFTAVKNAGSRDLVVIVRDGGGSPIKQFISSWSLTTSNQTINAIRTSDT